MKKGITLKIFALMSALLLTVLAFASCSAKAEGDVYYDENMSYGEAVDKAPSEGSTITSGSKNEMAEGSGESGGEAYTPKIIKTATIEAETKDFASATAELEAKVSALGGYIEKCNIREMRAGMETEEGTRYAEYTFRIPRDSLDGFLAEAGTLLNITSQSSSATDVSNEYYDMQARISVLETEREVLEKMLSESTSVSEMISLESRLYDVIYEIESYKTALKVYDSKVAYSTVNMTVNEVKELTPDTVDESFSVRFKNAVKESSQNFLEFCQGTVIALVYLAPVLIVFGAILVPCAAVILVAVLIIVKVIRKRRAKV